MMVEQYKERKPRECVQYFYYFVFEKVREKERKKREREGEREGAACQGLYMEVRGKLVRVDFLLPDLKTGTFIC